MAKEINTPKETTTFINPFGEGVSLKSFIDAVGDTPVADYVKGQFKNEVDSFDEADIKWLESEITKHEYNEKNKVAFTKIANDEHIALMIINTKKIEQ